MPTLIGNLLELEKKHTAGELAEIDKKSYSSPSERAQAVKDFLAARWQRIRGSNLSYVIATHDALTKDCLSRATSAAKILGESPYKILMPTLEILESDFTGQAIDDLKLHQFILSDDDRHFIEVEQSFTFAQSDAILKDTAVLTPESKPKPLSAQESRRMVNHTQASRKYYQALREEINYQKTGGSVALLCSS